MQINVDCHAAQSSPTDWWPIVVGGIQFLIGIALTFFTFRKDFQQKQDERVSSWYHKVVVDKLISVLASFIQSERVALEASGLECENARINANLSQAQITEKYVEAVSSFQQRLKPLRTELTNLALIFDKVLFDDAQRCTLVLDDRVSAWFAASQHAGVENVQDPMHAILSDFHRDVIRTFRLFEFEQLPKQSRRQKRGRQTSAH